MPQLHVDTEVIGRNTEVVASLLRDRGLDLVGVTKGCLGEPRVGAAMLAGGAIALADTRDHNLRRLRVALPAAELHRIYLPPVGAPFEPGDITYVSSVAGAAAVAAAPATASPSSRLSTDRPSPVGGSRRRVLIAVETGDLREGVPVAGLGKLAQAIAGDPRLELTGVATNYACFKGGPGGVRASLETIAAAARDLRAAGIPVYRVSGGNSSVLALLDQGGEDGPLPAEVTELRCGEALLLGHDALLYRRLPGCSCACVLRAEVLEEYTKSALWKGWHQACPGVRQPRSGFGCRAIRRAGTERSGSFRRLSRGRRRRGWPAGGDRKHHRDGPFL